MLPLIGTALGAGLSFFGARQKNREDKARFQQQNQITAQRFRDTNQITQRRINDANRISQARIDEANKITDRRILNQQSFQERMAGTAYQRGVLDMKKAGINPILAYKQGGAGSPSGASAPGAQAPASYAPGQTAAAVSTPSIDEITPAVASAMQARRLFAEVDNMQQTNQNLVQARSNMQSQQSQIRAQTNLTNLELLIKGEMLHSAKAAASAAKTDEAFFESKEGKVLRTLNRWLQAFTGSLNSAKRIGSQ